MTLPLRHIYGFAVIIERSQIKTDYSNDRVLTLSFLRDKFKALKLLRMTSVAHSHTWQPTNNTKLF